MNHTIEQLEKFKNLPKFDWDKAKAFYYVATIGSQIEAAKLLGTSQPSLSRQIAILEQELQCKLMKRTAAGLVLTRKGREFLRSVERFFLDLQKFNYNHVVLDNTGEKRKIRIAATQPVASYILSDYLMEYNELYPNIIFEVKTNDFELDVAINNVDLVIRPFDPKARGVKQEHLFTLRKKLYASDKYIEKYGVPEKVEDLKDHYFVADLNCDKRPFSNVQWSLKLGMPEGKAHEPLFVSDSVECLIDAAKKGLGIYGGYEQMDIIKNSQLQSILPELSGETAEGFCIYPEYLEDDEEFMKFKDYLIKKISPPKHNDKCESFAKV